MELDPADLDRRQRYFLMISAVVPRPIGWVGTVSAAGAPNLAPFSFFNGVCTDPPIVMVSVGRRRGAQKDTARNILETKEAVVHIPHRAVAEQMVLTSQEVDSTVDEFDLAGLTRVPSVKVRAPRVAEAMVAFETRLHEHHAIGHAPMDVFYLEVVYAHLADSVVTDGIVDRSKFNAVGRLGGVGYCDTSSSFDIDRPK